MRPARTLAVAAGLVWAVMLIWTVAANPSPIHDLLQVKFLHSGPTDHPNGVVHQRILRLGRGQIDDLTIRSQRVDEPASNGAQNGAPDST